MARIPLRDGAMHDPTEALRARIDSGFFDIVNDMVNRDLAKIIDEHGTIEIGTHQSKAHGLHLDPKLIIETTDEADLQLLTAMGLDAKPITTLWLRDAETVLTRVHEHLTTNYNQAALLLAAIALKDQIRSERDPQKKETLIAQVLKLRDDIAAMNAEGAGT